jgi:hypothetical protein
MAALPKYVFECHKGVVHCLKITLMPFMFHVMMKVGIMTVMLAGTEIMMGDNNYFL